MKLGVILVLATMLLTGCRVLRSPECMFGCAYTWTDENGDLRCGYCKDKADGR